MEIKETKKLYQLHHIAYQMEIISTFRTSWNPFATWYFTIWHMTSWLSLLSMNSKDASNALSEGTNTVNFLLWTLMCLLSSVPHFDKRWSIWHVLSALLFMHSSDTSWTIALNESFLILLLERRECVVETDSNLVKTLLEAISKSLFADAKRQTLKRRASTREKDRNILILLLFV